MPDARADRLVAIYEQAVYEIGGWPDPAETNWLRTKALKLLDDGIHEEIVAEAVVKMVGRHKFGGYMLGTFVNEVLAEHHDAPDKALLDRFLDAHDGRWPTGVAFKRGSHSGTYVADPLGYDKADYGQWRPPRRQEVLNALRARKG